MKYLIYEQIEEGDGPNGRQQTLHAAGKFSEKHTFLGGQCERICASNKVVPPVALQVVRSKKKMHFQSEKKCPCESMYTYTYITPAWEYSASHENIVRWFA